MKITWMLAATLLLTACGGGSSSLAPAEAPQTEQPNPFDTISENPATEPPVVDEPEVEPPTEDPVAEPPSEPEAPDPVEIPDSVTYDNTMLYQIEMVEVYDNSPTAMFMRTANFTDMSVSNIACRFTAYLNENPVMNLNTIQLFSPDGVAVSLSSGQEQTTRIVLNNEGYTGHHVDKIEWVCNHRFDELGGTTRSSGEWVGESVYGAFQ